MVRFSRDFAHPDRFLKKFQWENSFVPMADRFFFRSAKETSKVIPDVRGIGKVVQMKKREIQKICSGCLARYLKKGLEWIFRPKSLKTLAIGKRHNNLDKNSFFSLPIPLRNLPS